MFKPGSRCNAFLPSPLIVSRLCSKKPPLSSPALSRRFIHDDSGAKVEYTVLSIPSSLSRGSVYRSPSAAAPAPIKPSQPPRKRSKNDEDLDPESLAARRKFRTPVFSAQEKERLILQYIRKGKGDPRVLENMRKNAKLWARGEPKRVKKRGSYSMLDLLDNEEEKTKWVERISKLRDAKDPSKTRTQRELIHLILGGQFRALEPWHTQSLCQQPRYRSSVLSRRVTLRLPGDHPDPVMIDTMHKGKKARWAMGRNIVTMLISIAPGGQLHPFTACQRGSWNMRGTAIFGRALNGRDPRLESIGLLMIGDNPLDGTDCTMWVAASDRLLQIILDTIDSFSNKEVINGVIDLSYKLVMNPATLTRIIELEKRRIALAMLEVNANLKGILVKEGDEPEPEPTEFFYSDEDL
ncbi:hypothetical protein M422DRAFT_785838 [Sphaerobolus stellatus SS14]|uniref:Uncharacterized protein n=1 Tax=Sphaerobolus stellatus (strain SS14) TaxID=990650 RepID=A0A0C9UH87_SPHS4|nr:hypothetical protein M422DRAFT_785838 [Sphaerobolus stellatus SS14]